MEHRQTQLDFDNPIARKVDPPTSHEAEAKTNKTTRAKDREFMLELIRGRPNHTCGELVEICNKQFGMSVHRCNTMQKRLYDLSTDGKIVSTGERPCKETNHKARTWRMK